MNTSFGFFDSFKGMNILILGDVMIDSYVTGKVERISPEAPVPVVTVKNRYNRLGGAANVALNIKSLGANPILCSVIGNDQRGNDFISLLTERQMPTNGVIRSAQRPTTTKFRIIGNNSQMLRVDEESTHSLYSEEYIKLSVKLLDILNETTIDAIIIEDYDKGMINNDLIELITSEAALKNIPITADPKKMNFNSYKNLTLFKPNFKELVEGLNAEIAITDYGKIAEIAQNLITERSFKMVMITLSDYGLLIASKDEWFHIPAEIRQISDVSGAGDTVISTITLAIAAGLPVKDSAELANIAGGLVCEHIGVVPIDIKILKEEYEHFKK